MSILNTITFIVNHPLNRKRKLKALIRFINWQISSRLCPYPIVYRYAEKSRLIIWRGLHGATGNLYCGLDEFEDMAFLLHFMRDSDLFIDIGANVGSYTVLGASEVGANTIAIEPVPETFKTLKINLNLNGIQHRVVAHNIGLGSKKEVVQFTTSLDTVNHVAVKLEADTVDVQIERYDDVIQLERPTLVKMDVEGYETQVLGGMEKALVNDNLKAIIIELNGSGKRYGFDENEIHQKLISHGFNPYCYSPFDRKLLKIGKNGKHNTLYIKDIQFAQKRVMNARKYNILNSVI